MKYDFQTLKDAILFNTIEVLPTDMAQFEHELRRLVDVANEHNQTIRHYIGFEISGQIHFPGSVYQMLNVARLQKAGVECVLWLADYHTWINSKLDGKIETIRKVAHEYFEPVFRKCLQVAGGDPEKLVVLYAEDEYFKKNPRGLSFWDYEFMVEKNITLSRIMRSLSITGKEAGESVEYQLTRYPGMQAADIFWHQTHLVQAGLDQRKIYVLARDNADKLDNDFQLKIGTTSIKPIIFFNQLLLGLEKPVETVIEDKELTIHERQSLMHLQSEVERSGVVNLEDLDQTVASTTIQLINQHHAKTVEVNKMSKSKPDSAIWVHDSFDEILRKLKKSYCPMPRPAEQTRDQIVAEQIWNPMLDWSKKMIYPAGKVLNVVRKPEWGGDRVYNTYQELERDYFEGNLHPMDLKLSIAQCLADWFLPIKEYIDQHPQGLELVKAVGGKK